MLDASHSLFVGDIGMLNILFTWMLQCTEFTTCLQRLLFAVCSQLT